MFHRKLRHRLNAAPNPANITDLAQLMETTDWLTRAIQDTIEENVIKSKPRPDAKRWWNGDLKKMKKDLNRLRANSYKFCALADHPSHAEFRTKSTQYRDAIVQAKRQHWADYLEDMTASDIWMANRFIREPVGDDGCPRISALRTIDDEGAERLIKDNDEKANVLAKTFFPPPPPPPQEQEEHEYLEPLPDPPQISEEQVRRHISPSGTTPAAAKKSLWRSTWMLYG